MLAHDKSGYGYYIKSIQTKMIIVEKERIQAPIHQKNIFP